MSSNPSNNNNSSNSLPTCPWYHDEAPRRQRPVAAVHMPLSLALQPSYAPVVPYSLVAVPLAGEAVMQEPLSVSVPLSVQVPPAAYYASLHPANAHTHAHTHQYQHAQLYVETSPHLTHRM